MASSYQGYQAYGDPERAKLDRSRRLAEMLQEGALDTGPKSFWEGAAQLGKAFIARDAMGRADQAESAYGDTVKTRNARLAAALMPDAQGVANDQLNSATPFDLTPQGAGQRQAQTGANDRYRPIVEALLQEGNLGGAVDLTQSLKPEPVKPTIHSTSNGLVAVTDGKPELIYGTEPETKPQNLPPGMWYNPDTQEPEWIPGYEEGYRKLHPPSASSSGTKPPSGFQWVQGEDGPALAPIPGGPADKGLNMNPQFIAMELQQAKDWKGVYNNFSDITDQRGRIETMAARKDPAGDLALVVSFTKMLDPGSVAREGEVALTQSAASAIQQAQNWLPRLQQGNTLLPDDLRKQLLAAGQEMYGVYEKKYHDIAKDYEARSKAYGFAPERVMMGYRPMAPEAPAQAPPPGPGAWLKSLTGGFQPQQAPAPQAQQLPPGGDLSGLSTEQLEQMLAQMGER